MREARNPKCSIVLSTRNKASYLDSTLDSIRQQIVPFAYEIIVVDDGSGDETRKVCESYDVQYCFLENPRYRNPAVARNMGYRLARGDVIICQSDDVIHTSKNTIQYLTNELQPGEFLLAQVQDWKYLNNQPHEFVLDYCSPGLQHPYFFLGSLFRSDMLRIGGNCEEFVEPCWDDDWFASCLTLGLGLNPVYTDAVQGHHQHHGYPDTSHKDEAASKALYDAKMAEGARTGVYVGTGAPWMDWHNDMYGPDKIKKKMSFFWAGDRMSWMRYMTLKSFRHFHPDWEMLLYTTNVLNNAAGWSTHDMQDCSEYKGENYMKRLGDLDVKIVDWSPPVVKFPKLVPAQASDICEWEILADGDGFFSDMDILYVAPIPYETLKKADVVCCLTLGYMTIGFFGAAAGTKFFEDILIESHTGYSPGRYQSAGAEAIYRLGDLGGCWSETVNPGDVAMRKLRKKYPHLDIVELKSEQIYPWSFREVQMIFERNRQVPEDCIGIHWFGASPHAQKWNNTLTADNYQEDKFRSTFTQYVALMES